MISLKTPIIFLVDVENERLDKFIASKTKNFSREEIKQIILNEGVLVNNKVIKKPSFLLSLNQEIKIIKNFLPKDLNAKPQNIALDIIYEDEYIAIINKPKNMVVHPAVGNYENTLANGLVYHFKNLSNLNHNTRPGIVHRIDKNTSGLLIVTKTNEAHHYFASLIKKHEVKREYKAIVEGIIDKKILHINLPIGRNEKNRKKMCVTNKNSKEAITHVEVIKTINNKYTLIKCELETGRTHQIRVHLSYIKHPIVGDDLYGKYKDEFFQRLHAYKLSFKHITGEQKTFIVDEPSDFYDNLD